MKSSPAPVWLLACCLVSCGCDSRIRHGINFTVVADTNHIGSAGAPDFQKVGEVLRKRIDSLGFRSSVEPLRDTRLRLSVPKDAAGSIRAVRIALTRAGLIEFHLVHPDNVNLLRDGIVPPDCIQMTESRVDARGGKAVSLYLVRKQAIHGVSGRNIESATVMRNSAGQPEIAFRFDRPGQDAFAKLTTENVGQFLAIVLDRELYSVPRIAAPITSGAGRITSGTLSIDDAHVTAVLLQHPLEVPLKIIEESSF